MLKPYKFARDYKRIKSTLTIFHMLNIKRLFSRNELWQVRVYTPKGVFQELEVAKQEYIRATFGVLKDQKILLPKLVESFTKESGLCPAGVMEMIQQSLPESLRKSVKKCHLAKSRKSIEWIPHNFTFRYLIPKELVKWSLLLHCLVLTIGNNVVHYLLYVFFCTK